MLATAPSWYKNRALSTETRRFADDDDPLEGTVLVLLLCIGDVLHVTYVNRKNTLKTFRDDYALRPRLLLLRRGRRHLRRTVTGGFLKREYTRYYNVIGSRSTPSKFITKRETLERRADLCRCLLWARLECT